MKTKALVRSDRRIDKVLETIISCKNEEQLAIAKEWVNRLQQKPYTRFMATNSFFKTNYENTLYRKNTLLNGGRLWK
jgi:hypothetical protein